MRAPQYNRDSLITLALLAGGGFLLYKAVRGILDINKGTPYQGAGPVGTAANIMNQVSGGTLAAAGSWLGTKLYDWTHSGGSAGLSTVYVVAFPNGTSHAINPNQVNSDGRFMYESRVYQIKVDANGKKYAVPQ